MYSERPATVSNAGLTHGNDVQSAQCCRPAGTMPREIKYIVSS